MDGTTTRHEGYAIFLICRWLVEKCFGRLKQTDPVRQMKVRGVHEVDSVFRCAADNLLQLPRLIAQQRTGGLQQQCAWTVPKRREALSKQSVPQCERRATA